MKTADPWGWMSNAAFLAPSAHIGWSLAIVSIAAPHFGPWLSAGLFLACWAIPKETWDTFPAPWGEGDTIVGSLTDFLGYVAGSTLAVGLHFLLK